MRQALSDDCIQSLIPFSRHAHSNHVSALTSTYLFYSMHVPWLHDFKSNGELLHLSTARRFAELTDGSSVYLPLPFSDYNRFSKPNLVAQIIRSLI